VLASVGAFGTFIAAEEIDHAAAFKMAPEEGPTKEYGGYLVDVFGCRHCHGMDLNGGKAPDPNSPFSPNITTGGAFGSWSQLEFDKAMRTGQTPDGRQLSYFMPWQATKNMSDENLQAVYAYLKSIPKLETAKQ
jgi:cytochrome c553